MRARTHSYTPHHSPKPNQCMNNFCFVVCCMRCYMWFDVYLYLFLPRSVSASSSFVSLHSFQRSLRCARREYVNARIQSTWKISEPLRLCFFICARFVCLSSQWCGVYLEYEYEYQAQRGEVRKSNRERENRVFRVNRCYHYFTYYYLIRSGSLGFFNLVI